MGVALAGFLVCLGVGFGVGFGVGIGAAVGSFGMSYDGSGIGIGIGRRVMRLSVGAGVAVGRIQRVGSGSVRSGMNTADAVKGAAAYSSSMISKSADPMIRIRFIWMSPFSGLSRAGRQ